MRGRHGEYIQQVNEKSDKWYIDLGGGKWVTTVELIFRTIAGTYVIPVSSTTDLFTYVPNTGYVRFHKAALLHDALREDARVSRVVSDVCFLFEMIDAIKDIYTLLIHTDCPKKVINKEIFRLCRVAALYMLGVSGFIGSLYIKLDRYF